MQRAESSISAFLAKLKEQERAEAEKMQVEEKVSQPEESKQIEDPSKPATPLISDEIPGTPQADIPSRLDVCRSSPDEEDVEMKDRSPCSAEIVAELACTGGQIISSQRVHTSSSL